MAIFLTFSESIRLSTLEPEQITFQNNISDPSQSYTLTGGTTTFINERNIMLELSFDDQNLLKGLTDLLTTEANTYLSHTAQMVEDTSGNAIKPIRDTMALQASFVGVDMDRPILISFDYDANSNQVILYFNETVNATTLDPSLITLHNNNSVAYTLHESSTTTDFITDAVSLSLSPEDTAAIKLLGLCTTADACYIEYEEGLVRDIVNMTAIPLNASNAVQVNEVVPDKTPPRLLSFEYSIDNASLVLHFNEPVNVNLSTTDIADGLTLKNYIEPPIESYSPVSAYVVTSNDSQDITIQLGLDDAAMLPAMGICLSHSTCYITLSSSFSDISENEIMTANTLVANEVIPPEFCNSIEEFSLDLNARELFVVFKRAINVLTVTPNTFVLHNGQNATNCSLYFDYFNTRLSEDSDRTLVVIIVNPSNIQCVYSVIPDMFSTANNTMLCIETPNVVSDYYGTGSCEVLCSESLYPTTVISDFSGPVLEEAALDLNLGQLKLIFDESVQISSIDLLGISLVNSTSMENASTLNFTGGQILEMINASHVVTVQLHPADIATLKLTSNFGTERDNTYIIILSNSLNDTSMNPIQRTERRLSAVYPDITAPLLNSFEIDLNNGTLRLSFSDVIDPETFDIAAVTIQDDSHSSVQYTFSKAESFYSDDNYTMIIIVDALELIQLKITPRVGSDKNNTFITLAAFAIDDVEGRDVIAVTDGRGIQASNVIVDTTPPQLTSFDLDMDSGTIFLTFTDSINLDTFNLSGVNLQTNESVLDPNDYYTLNSGIVMRSFEDVSVLVINISESDLNEIKKMTHLAVSEDTTYLSTSDNTAEDAAFNSLTLVPKTRALQVTQLWNDSTNPILRSFTLNLDNGILMLSFSETIRLNSFNYSAITFQSSTNITLAEDNHTLTGGIINGTSGNSSEVYIILSSYDLNTLKSIPTLATVKANTYLSLSNDSFMDMNYNSADSVSMFSAQEALDVFQDMTNPVLDEFQLDMNTGVLELTFTEYVDPDTFKPFEATILDDSNNMYTDLVQLTGGIASSNLNILRIELSNNDLYELQNATSLALDETSTFFTASEQFVQDASKNNMVAVPLLLPKMANAVINDTEGPILISYTLDLDEYQLELTFNEVVNASSWTISQIVLQDGEFYDSSNTSLALNSSTISSINHYVQVVHISNEDKEGIDVDDLLATSHNTTYLNITQGGVFDMNGNPVESSDNATQVANENYIRDETPPNMLQFNLDLNSGSLQFIFTEAIDPATFNVSLLTISSLEILGRSYQIQHTPPPTGTSASHMSVILDDQDLNALKADPFLVSNKTMVSYPDDAFRDVYGNMAEENSVTPALLPDTTGPTLLEYYLDLDANTLTLQFSEALNQTTFDLSSITLHSNYSGNVTVLELTEPEKFEVIDFHIVHIDLGFDDVNAIKALQTLAIDNATTFLTATDHLIQDTSVFHNQNQPISTPKQVEIYTADTTPVSFQRFDLNLSTNILTLYFDEPIERATLNISEMILFDMANTSHQFIFENAIIPNENTNEVVIQLYQTDINELNLIPICSRKRSCYINLTAEFAIDTAANVLNTTINLPANVDSFGEDTVRPQLVQFSVLDLNEGQITLVFTESVLSEKVMPQQLNLTDWYTMNGRDATVELSGGNVISDSGTEVTIQLLNDDLNDIKLERDTLCRRSPNCWVRLGSEFVEDPFMNYLIAIIDRDFDETEAPLVIIPDTSSPVLLNFTLDIDQAELVLSFDEVIDQFTFDATAITIQGNFTSSPSIQLTSGGTILSDPLTTELVLILNDQDITNIKAELSVATSQETTWLVYTEAVISDVYDNPIEPTYSEINATMAAVYLNDTTSPTVVSFTILSLQDNQFGIEFSEPVLPSSFKSELFTIHSSFNVSEPSHILTGGIADDTALQSDTPYILFIAFDGEDLTEIKKTDGLANSKETSWITINNGAVTDTAGNPVNQNTLNADNYEQDQIPPTLVSFSLDMDNGEVVLTFDDVVNPSKFRYDGVQFQNEDASSTFQLTQGSSDSDNGFNVNFTIVKNDLDRIKMIDDLATNINDTYVFVSALVVEDTSSPSLPAISATIQASDYINDTTKPELVDFTYNADVGSIVFLFSEAVNVSSLEPTGILLLNSNFSNVTTQRYRLTGGSSVPNYTAVMFEMQLNFDDLSAIQELTNLATLPDNTYISIQEGAIADMAGNIIDTVPANGAKQGGHQADLLAPTLQYFQFDLNNGTITFTFSESVNVNSFNASKITLASARNTAAQQYTLTGGFANITDTDLGGNVGVADHDVEVVFTLSTDDLNEIKAQRMLAINIMSTNLYFDTGAVVDSGGNAIEAVSLREAYVARNFTDDDTNPELIEFSIDLNTDILSLTFSETVAYDKLNITAITILNDPINATEEFNLTDGTILSGDRPIINILLSTEDLNQLKVTDGILTSEDDTYITVTEYTAEDNRGNPVTHPDVPIRATLVKEDTKNPFLLEDVSELDMNSGNLTLYFSESVLVSSIYPPSLTIQNGQPGTVSFNLSLNSTSQSKNGSTIIIEISRTDLNTIKRLTNLAVDPLTTYVSIQSDFITDTFGNPLLSIAPENASRLLFIPDETHPNVMAFDLSLTDGVRRPLLLSIQFSETIDNETFQVTEFALQRDQNGSDRIFLTGGNFTQKADDIILVEVLDSDFEMVIAIADFLRNNETSYLFAQSDAVFDTNQNPLLEEPGIMVRLYDVDLVAPVLQSFYLDLDSGEVTLIWSEVVLLDTLKPENIMLQSNTTTLSIHMIRNATVTYGSNTSSTVITLSTDDLNTVKARLDLATSVNDTYISMVEAAIFDVASNPSDQLDIAIQAIDYIKDSTRPQLSAFDIMLTTQTLTLYFTETMDPTSLDPTGIIFQDRFRQASFSYRLTNGTTNSPPHSVIELDITDDDLNAIKEFENLFTNENNAYLSLASYVIKDTAGNPVITTPPSNALRVRNYNNDTLPPMFESFDINLSTRNLLITFTETVNVSTFVPALFTLSNSDTNPTVAINLTTSTPTNTDLAVVTIMLSDEDFNSLSHNSICTTRFNCYLTVSENALQDQSGLYVLENTEVVETWIPDENAPVALELSSFNLLNGSIIIEFSETVDSSKINYGELTFQSLYTDPIEMYTLTDGVAVNGIGTRIEILLTEYDLNRIKEKEYLCTTQGSCYITFTANFIQDIAGNNIMPQLSGEAPGLVAMDFIPDSKAPELISFVFDSRVGALLMTFSEPVQVALINPTAIHIQGEANSTEFFTLTGGTAGTMDSDKISFNLSTSDFYAVQSLNYATRENNTYISIDSIAFRDTSLMPVFIILIPNSNATQASGYISDDIAPYVESFILNLVSDELVITFSEAISITSVSISELVLIGNDSIPASFVQLTGGIVRPVPDSNEPGSVVITIELNQPDTVSIKTNVHLATSRNTTMLRVLSGFVTDTAGVTLLETGLITASELIEDNTAVELVSFALDVNIGVLYLTFSDVVDASTFDTRAITIQSEVYSDPESQYTLTESSTASDIDDYYIVVTIGPVDIFRLKSTPGVATSINSTYLTMFASAVDDVFGVDILSITNGKALPADNFTADTDPPIFDGFDLDMNDTTITLFFSEAVDILTLNFQNLTIYTDSNISLSVSNFTLSGGDLVQSDDGRNITIILLTDNANVIQQDIFLATSEENTFLSLPYASIQDIVGHNTIGTAEGIAVQVLNYTGDLSSPQVLKFTLDANLGWLNITFSETVNITTVDVTKISLQNRQSFNMFTASVTAD